MTVFINGFVALVQVCAGLLFGLFYLCLLLCCQRLLREIVQAERTAQSFDITEIRASQPQATVYMGLFPKGSNKKPDFLNVWAPAGVQISKYDYGYLIVTEGECFMRFHSDHEITVDSLITLYGNGRKLWFFVRPSNEAREIEDSVMTPDSLMGILQRLGSAIVSCSQEVGDTIYLPYGWLHCVVTLGNVARCSSLLSIGLKITRERFDRMWRLVCGRLPVDQRRQEKYIDGPRHVDLER